MCYIVFTEKHFRQCFVDMKIKTKKKKLWNFLEVIACLRKIADFIIESW